MRKENDLVFYNEDAEYALIATCLTNPEIISGLNITSSDFFTETCREAFAAMVEMSETGLDINPVSVAEFVSPTGAISRNGGLVWLGNLVMNMPCAPKAADGYVKIVVRYSKSRKLAQVSTDIHKLAGSHGVSESEKRDAAIEMLSEVLRENKEHDETVHVLPALENYIQTLEDRYDNELPGIPTGYSDLDEIVGGFKPTDFIVVGARPSMGKTSFAVNIATKIIRVTKSAAGEGDHGIVVFTQEMPTNAILDRAIAGVGSIPLQNLIRGRLTEEEYTKLSSSIAVLHESPLWINDASGLTLGRIRSELTKLKAKGHKIKGIVIDYLQLMQGPGKTRNEQIEVISRGIKQICKDFDVFSMVLSQLTRDVEKREDKRPKPADLRDSGSIEQDADIIMFIYRDEVYRPDSQDKGIAEIIIGKNRNGPLGTVRTIFRNEYTRFDPMPSRDCY